MDSAKKMELLEEMLEMDAGELTEDMILEDIETWDSMAKLSLIVLVDDECAKKLTGDQIKQFVTVGDILDFMG
ncbi:MAG: acyl carrier protein [Candidatus Fimivivens sp.]|nr:acyl carrier protein [Candidatus Fimivivens sp.]